MLSGSRVVVPDPAPPKKVRASGPRSRKGCIPCKSRHVRCDELRPVCANCRRLGIHCHGHGQKRNPSIRRRSQPRVLLPGPYPSRQARSLPITPTYCTLDGSDIVYFDAFRYAVVHDVAGIGYADFWTRTVMSESLTDECIQYAIMAISGLALSKPNVLSCNDSASLERKYQQAAMLYHVKALSTFSRRIASNILEPRSVLLFTVLIAVFELMHDNPSAAGLVIARGFRLLSSHFTEKRQSQASTTIDAYPSPGLENIADMKHIWLRLPCMACMLPFVPTDVRSEMIEGTISISSLPESDSGMDKIYRSWREIGIQDLKVRMYAEQSAQHGCEEEVKQAESHLTELINTYRSWGDILERRIGTEKDPQISWSLRLMRVEQLNQLIFRDDSYRALSSDALKRFVFYCEDLMTESKRNALRTRMTTHAGVLPFLSNVIRLCKYPDVRNLAIATLERCHPFGADPTTTLLK